jgi:hypothetical protein
LVVLQRPLLPLVSPLLEQQPLALQRVFQLQALQQALRLQRLQQALLRERLRLPKEQLQALLQLRAPLVLP